MWRLSHRFDSEVLPLADRHYNRQKHGTPQFAPPGRCLVLKHGDPVGAMWVTSWPFYTKHRWAGAWVCSAFRREVSVEPASCLIRAAVACTRWRYPETPDLGMVTFVDPRHVRPTMVRGNPVWGWTWLKAGFRPDGETIGGLLAFRLFLEDMPGPEAPVGAQTRLFG